jgi:hypothetical protein
MKKVIIGILAVSLAFTQCDKKDDAAPQQKASLTFSVNGTSKEASVSSGVLSFRTQHSHQVRYLQISSIVEGNHFSIAVSNWDFQNPPNDSIKVKTYNNVFAEQNIAKSECLPVGGNVSLCDRGFVTYVVDADAANGKTYMSGFYDGDYNGFIKISACNPANKTVSGEYDVKVDDGDGVELTLKGKFENVIYLVVG